MNISEGLTLAYEIGRTRGHIDALFVLSMLTLTAIVIWKIFEKKED